MSRDLTRWDKLYSLGSISQLESITSRTKLSNSPLVPFQKTEKLSDVKFAIYSLPTADISTKERNHVKHTAAKEENLVKEGGRIYILSPACSGLTTMRADIIGAMPRKINFKQSYRCGLVRHATGNTCSHAVENLSRRHCS